MLDEISGELVSLLAIPILIIGGIVLIVLDVKDGGFGVMGLCGVVMLLIGGGRVALSVEDDRARTRVAAEYETARETAKVELAELVGATGSVATDLRPTGKVEIDDRRLDAVSVHGFVEAGTRVKVVRADGVRVVVAPSPPEKAPPDEAS